MTVVGIGKNPALIVVDMQNGFCDPQGHRSRIGLGHESDAAVVKPIRRLLEAARHARVPVFFTKFALKADYSDAGLLLEKWPELREAEALVSGTWGVEIVPELQPLEGENVIEKTRHSAFFGTDLETCLRAAEVDTLIVCGVTTNICVESTVRDAFCRDFRVIVPADGTSAPTREMHERGLLNVSFAFGAVTSVSDLVEALGDVARHDSPSDRVPGARVSDVPSSFVHPR